MEESIIEFPICVNVPVETIENTESDEVEQEIVQYHVVEGLPPIPVYCVGSKAVDTESALKNTLHCPVRYLSQSPPAMVTENFCFIVDGDVVDFEVIQEEAADLWKDTGTATRYYFSDTMRTFYQVTMLMSRGQIKSAYRRRRVGCGMEAVPLEKVFRVCRSFSYWRSCKYFHRIVSLVSPITKEGEDVCGFRKRVFVQYLWRTRREGDRHRVAIEYAASRKANSEPATRKQSRFAGAMTSEPVVRKLSRMPSRSPVRKKHSVDFTPLPPPFKNQNS